MSGFLRRFGFFPGSELITQIEGVVIVDLPPPGSIQGVGTGTVALVGEFADMTYAVSVASDGTVTTNPQPVEVFSSQDMLNKVGGWDETLGEFGGDGGSGFLELRNKRFTRLVLVPVNLASSKGIRLWRKLPTNQSATVALPVVPVQQGIVAAGREFKSGANRVRVGKRVSFTSLDPIVSGTDGAVTSAGAAATQSFDSATGAFVANGIKEGDILVVGVIGAGGAQGANADTYRVVSITDADTIVVQKMDGTNFDWTTGTGMAWRLHHASDADTGLDHQFSEEQGYLIPARPLDATVAASTLLTPTVVPPALSASSADPLSGLAARTTTNAAGLVYTAAIQAPNAPNVAGIDALYQLAINALLNDETPSNEVDIVFSARKSANIRNYLKQHVLDASARALTRVETSSPSLDAVLSVSAAVADSDPGVGANRDERVIYDWPGVRTFVPEAVGFSVKLADGTTTSDGILDVTSDGWMAVVLSNLPPERNPGQSAPPVPELLSPILGFQRGLTDKLNMNHYIQLRSKGIAAPRIDRSAGPIFQSGITTSLTAGQKNINRRRMADFIEDSIAIRINQYVKLLLTDDVKDSAVSEIEAFLTELRSPDNPPAQRIADYAVDRVSGNTPQLEAQGIFVIIVQVRTLSTADFIVLQFEIGEGVTPTTT